MAASTEPTAILSHLHRTDGSATFSHNGYTIIAAVNGPIEVQRRDALPEEAAVDITVRPAAGVGGTRERHLESILQSTLRQIILIHNFPRTMIQVTLQITSTPENDYANTKLNQASSNLPILPALLQASVLALLSAALPLAVSMSSTLLALEGSGSTSKIVENPSILEIQRASSIHVLAFTSYGDLLVAESEGSFTLEDWNAVHDLARRICCGGGDADAMRDDEDDEDGDGMIQFVKATLEEKVNAELHWGR